MPNTFLVLVSKEHTWCKPSLATCCTSDSPVQRVPLVQSWWKAAQCWVSRPGTSLGIHPILGELLSSTAVLCCPLLLQGGPVLPAAWQGLGCGTPPQPRPYVFSDGSYHLPPKHGNSLQCGEPLWHIKIPCKPYPAQLSLLLLLYSLPAGRKYRNKGI